MLDVILLVPGVPALLLALVLVLGRFEAVVAPDAPDVERSPTARAREPAVVRSIAADAAALGEDAEHSRAA